MMARKEEEEKEEEEEEEEECGGASEMSSVQYDHLHQLFVTKNQVLCSEVQKNFCELCHADVVAEHHVEVEEAAMPHRLQDVDEYKFPLFLTSRQLILMLDASLPAPHFFERNEDGSLKVIIQGWGADEEIFAFVPLEDDSDDSDEREYFEEDEEGERREREERAAADRQPKKKDIRREVTYDVFAHEIWPKITKKAQVNYHPSLVWTEITSFIKGSFAAVSQRLGFLDKDSYEQLGRKQAPNFTGSRDKVYELFLRYNDYKRQHGLYDEADLVFHIYQRLKLAGPLPWVLHEVFVDETQDFTQAELTILIRLAHSPNDMFLTGDTAQSIMRGVSFRFSDLKTLFHYAKQSLKARGKTGVLEVPRQVYQLTHNYRSHAGILSLASAILDLLVEFFPESFDRLEKDQGMFDGPPPVVLESGSAADLAILLSGNKRKTSHIEFGAHQVILVVNDEARNNLPEELGLGLVLTIYEAKGLEFDDVLLYNFFKDSEASKEWRVVTDFLERLSKNEASTTNSSGLVQIDEVVLRQTGRPRPLTFDPNLHKILNSELKHLYTALTRARVNVWIFDQDADKRAPMFEYFKARKLVKFVSMQEGGDEEGVAQSMFAEKSSPEEWEKRGDEIMQRSLYDVAAKCYAMAGATHKQNIAIAHQRALKASHLRSQPRQMREAFLKAAILFLECHKELVPSSSTLALRFNLVTKAGRCLQNARENHLAAMVFEKNGQHEVAGPLYLRARKWLAASQCFEQVDNFGRALKVLDEQEMYDQAMDCLQRYKIRKQEFERKGLPVPKALIDNKPEATFTIASLSYKAARLYHRYGETKKMLAAIERLPDKEDQIKFLQKHGYLEDAAQLMCSDGRITEAARMMLHNGQVDKAILIAEEGTDNSLKAQCYWFKAQKLMASKSKKATAKAADGGKDHVSAAAVKEEDKKKPSPTKTSKKKSSELPSSDEDDDADGSDRNAEQQVVELLERARQQFDLCKDYSGMGDCQLGLAQLRRDEKLLEEAYKNFGTTQPFPNVAGMLECVEVLHTIKDGKELDFQSCRRLIWGVERVFDVVRVLLHPATAEEKNKYQVYLMFYGLETSGEGRLVLHPKLKPRCMQMIGAKNLFTTKEEKKAEQLYLSATKVCSHLAMFLIFRTKAWFKELEFHLETRLPKVIQCRSFQEGHCEKEEFCPYLHESYTQGLSDQAINVLSSQVRLDRAIQTGVEALLKIDIMLSELTESLTSQEHKWNSVETLLEFIFPSGLLTYNMSCVLRFCDSVAKDTPVYSGVHDQVQRYLQYLWDNPGRVGKGKSTNVLKERCKSTNWIVLATLLVPLFNLKIKVDDMCQKVELQLAQERPRWMRKRHKYALLIDKKEDYVMLLARRHLEALEYLQPSKFDPFEALIKFTKFVKLLWDRGEVGLMPDLRIFLFWLEFFVALSLCLAVKIRGDGMLMLPSSYQHILRLFSQTLPGKSRGQLLKLLEDFKLARYRPLRLLHDRLEVLMSLLCGGSTSSSFCLLTHLAHLDKREPTTHLLTERTLILALTLLVNVEQNNVPGVCEVPILQCMQRIRASKMQDMPPRLATLIDRVQAAASYEHIISALNESLGSMNEHVQFCKRDKNRLTPVPAASVRAGGPFSRFQPERLLQGTAGVAEAVVEDFDKKDDDINDTEGGCVEEEEAEVNAEDKARIQQQMAEAQKRDDQSKAGRVLLKFFRSIIFKKRSKRLVFNCLLQTERELFSPFVITERMCGVCGVRFEKASVPPKAPPSAEGEKATDEQQEEEEEEEEEQVVARLKQAHITSEGHRVMDTNFGFFCKMYHSIIMVPLFEIGAFLSKYEVKKRKDTWYKSLEFPVTSVLQKIENLQQQLSLTIQGRKWTERAGLIMLRDDLFKFFMEHVRGPVSSTYNALQTEEKRMAADKEAERQHQERLKEGFVDDLSCDKILEVVERPKQAAPNPNAPGGRGAPWANHPRGQGRGHVSSGGHGGTQSERGKIPPRFQRKPQN